MAVVGQNAHSVVGYIANCPIGDVTKALLIFLVHRDEARLTAFCDALFGCGNTLAERFIPEVNQDLSRLGLEDITFQYSGEGDGSYKGTSYFITVVVRSDDRDLSYVLHMLRPTTDILLPDRVSVAEVHQVPYRRPKPMLEGDLLAIASLKIIEAWCAQPG